MPDHKLCVRCLFPIFMRFPEAHPRPSAVFVDELDPGSLKATPYNIERGSSRFVRSGFQLTHGHDPNLSSVCKLLLAPIQEASSGPTLARGDHVPDFAQKF
jgi:hypothetical protein